MAQIIRRGFPLHTAAFNDATAIICNKQQILMPRSLAFSASSSSSNSKTRSRPRVAQHRGRNNLNGQTRETKLGNVPSMRDFLHIQKVKSQYRSFLRTVAMIPDEKWRELAKKEVVSTFEFYKNDTDKLAITMAVKEGERKLKDVQNMVGYTDKTSTQGSGNGDSWLNIDDKEDPRGRVGVEWPWEKKD